MKCLQGFLFCVALICLLSSCTTASKQPTPQTLSDAQSLYKKGQHKDALGIVNEILLSDSNNLEAHELRGKLLFHFSDTLQAEAEFAKVLASDSTSRGRSKWMEDQMDWNFEQGRDSQAMAILDAELKLPNLDSAREASMTKHALKTVLHHKDTSRALSILQAELKEHKTWYWLHLKLANIYHDQHKYKDASKHYQAYTDHSKPDAGTHYDAGMCYLHLRNKSQALAHLKKAADMGHTKACKQYREMTAVTKYSTYSRCCDGTTSSSTGRGTCSHHGGVCGLIREPYKVYTIECR